VRARSWELELLTAACGAVLVALLQVFLEKRSLARDGRFRMAAAEVLDMPCVIWHSGDAT
jgi:hypothetical protein